MSEKIKLYGIFGFPLKHTLSPVMQGAAFEQYGIPAFYLPFEMRLKDFREVMRALADSPLQGFNLTVPYKEAVFPYLDKVSEEARRIGAVNTVYRKGKNWCGANTDVEGFVRSLREETKYRFSGTRALVLGAGGAARAVVYGLAKEKVREIIIANRHPERARKLIRVFSKYFPRVRMLAVGADAKALKDAVQAADLIVNATSLGLKTADASPLSAAAVPAAGRNRKKIFMDLIYSPAKTRFLQNAARKKHITVNGAGMLVHQGARAFELWTKRKAPVSLMRKALMTALKE